MTVGKRYANVDSLFLDHLNMVRMKVLIGREYTHKKVGSECTPMHSIRRNRNRNRNRINMSVDFIVRWSD